MEAEDLQPPAESVAQPTRFLQRALGFAWTVSASFGTFGFFAIQGIILARMLGPAGRGMFAAAVLFPQALLYLGLLGAQELFAGYAAEPHDNAKLRRSAALYGLLCGSLSLLACVFLNLVTLPQEFRSILPLAMLGACTMPLQQIRLSVQAVDHGQRQLRRYNQVRLAAAASFPLMLLCGWALGFRSLSNAVVIFVIAQAASLLLVQFGMTGSWFGPRDVTLPKALHDARGLMIAWLSTEVLERLDLVLMMLLVANDTVLGHYSAAIPIAALMIIVPNSVGLYAFNRGARREEHLSTRAAWRYLLLGVAVQIVCGGALAAVLPFLVPLFYGDDFLPTVTYAWLLIPAAGLRGLLLAADGYLRARKKATLGIKARLLGIPVVLLVSILGMAVWEEKAIPIGLSLAQAVCFIILALGVIAETKSTNATREL